MPIVRRVLPRWFSLFGLFLLLMSGLFPGPALGVTEVGLLAWKCSELHEKSISAFQEELASRTSDVVILRRDARCSEKAFRRYLAELVQRPVSVIVLAGTGATLKVLRDFPRDSLPPLVALAVSDPSILDLDGSRGGERRDVTGTTYFLPLREHFALFSYLYPEARSISFLYNPSNPAGNLVEKLEINRVGKELGYEVHSLPVASVEDLEIRVRQAAAAADMIVLATNKLLFGNAARIVYWAEDVPVFSLSEEGVAAGAVAACYADLKRVGQLAARQVIQILQGIPVAKIPFAFPDKGDLAVNLASARRWGILVPREIMRHPSMVWRAANCPEWYRADGRLKGFFRLWNDADDRSFLRLGLICEDVNQCRPFLAGVIQGLRSGRSNYEVEAVDVMHRPEVAMTALHSLKRQVDLIVTIGEGLLELVKDRELPVPVVFTGASVSRSMALVWKNRYLTGSSCDLELGVHTALLDRLFGRERTFLVTRSLSRRDDTAEGQQLYLEMLTSGFSDVETVFISPALAPPRQAERLLRALSERLSCNPGGPLPVLIVTAEGQLYQCLPALGKLLSEKNMPVPVYVTSGTALRWGGTLAPDITLEEIGAAAGRYVTRILEQGVYPGDLPVWRGRGIRGICVNRRWKEISRWEVPADWKGRIREIVTEDLP